MNIIKIMGGIGNQFFQYAFGSVFEERGIEVVYDLSWYDLYSKGPTSSKFPRIYRMDKFRVNINTDPAKTRQMDYIKNRDSIIENNKPYDARIFELDHKFFEGYWQHYKFIKHLLPKFQNELLLKDEVKTHQFLRLAEEITRGESIAIHVRRGDYIGLWPVLPVSYYSDAIKRLSGDLYVFSDDIRWCRAAFANTGRKTTIVDTEDYLAFELMRLCKHKITGNSTFSWWAAWLGGGTVFCPKHWLGWSQVRDSHERYPEGWIQIS